MVYEVFSQLQYNVLITNREDDMRQWLAIFSIVTITGCSNLSAQEGTMSASLLRVTAQGTAESAGTVSFRDSIYGLIIEPSLQGLPPGPLGAHIHQNPDCGPGQDGTPGGAAGGHYDPQSTGQHLGPYNEGHLGDLPNLLVEQDGSVKLPALAPRLKLADLAGRSLMIHAQKDDYHEHPGGARLYCGVIH
jgi:Cu-Zn family superoxide dismutase